MNTANYKNKTFVQWETPYGMAWMLDLVMQRKKTTGDDGLRPLAVYAAAKLKSYLESLSAEDLKKEAMKPAHDNLTWGMIHLARWAKYIHDKRLLKLIQAKILPVLMDPALDKSCPVSADTTSKFAEFFPT
ncbi:hypothetical protein CEP54_016178 [Fusarium duplospermum]|uniref:Uncharacterized protein n=1 Tax=Fusarium duplospermum TaxID=1325734 RepID=A0A428NH95_9HYPO|nr:hypothetical protein CEP54_016178 [Fusarium duplospermum]